MTQLDPQVPVVLLLHDGTANLAGKTGLAMLRYRKGPIVAVVDPDGEVRAVNAAFAREAAEAAATLLKELAARLRARRGEAVIGRVVERAHGVG